MFGMPDIGRPHEYIILFPLKEMLCIRINDATTLYFHISLRFPAFKKKPYPTNAGYGSKTTHPIRKRMRTGCTSLEFVTTADIQFASTFFVGELTVHATIDIDATTDDIGELRPHQQ